MCAYWSLKIKRLIALVKPDLVLKFFEFNKKCKAPPHRKHLCHLYLNITKKYENVLFWISTQIKLKEFFSKFYPSILFWHVLLSYSVNTQCIGFNPHCFLFLMIDYIYCTRVLVFVCYTTQCIHFIVWFSTEFMEFMCHFIVWISACKTLIDSHQCLKVDMGK